MTKKYIPSGFEKKWQKYWKENKIYQAPVPDKDKKNNKYILTEFPYPSGSGLHTGHVREYVGGDILARFFRMKGKNVLYPTGWDAFGLPTENAAKKTKKNPADLTCENIKVFKNQMRMLGLSFDWSREVATCDSDYYAITQWLFIQFFKMGLLVKTKTVVDYCDFCQTNLAQEEVLSDGTHERCGKPAIKKELPQWIFRITKYADKLLEGLDGLDWPKGVIEMQKNWIGKKEGALIKFKIIIKQVQYHVSHSSGSLPTLRRDIPSHSKQVLELDYIECFTTRPDTLFGVTFLVIAPQLAQKWIKKGWQPEEQVLKFIENKTKKIDTKPYNQDAVKQGIDSGLQVSHPVTGKSLPVWISDYVIGDVGTGAIMGVPGHDSRDYEFAKKYNLPIKFVIEPKENVERITKNVKLDPKYKIPNAKYNFTYEGEGILVNSGKYNGLDSEKARQIIIEDLEKKYLAKNSSQYHLRNWIFSRQRYWGEPIPMIFCQKCADSKISFWINKQKTNYKKQDTNKKEVDHNTNNIYQKYQIWIDEIEKDLYGWFPLSDDDLPLKLPYIKNYKDIKSSQSPLAGINDFVNSVCPNCGSLAKQETDTMPNWAGSCWYYLYFAMQNEGNSKHESRNQKQYPKSKNLNIQNRFQNFNSNWLPVDIYIGGAEHTVLHLLYSRFWIKMMFDLGIVNFDEPFIKRIKQGIVIAEDGRKMSKSFGNIINPDEVVKEYGADTIRIYEMFMAPFDQDIKWSTSSLQGSYRFLNKIWQIYTDSANITNDINQEDKKLAIELQKLILKITSDITDVKFNTCISSFMTFINKWEDQSQKLIKSHPEFISGSTLANAHSEMLKQVQHDNISVDNKTIKPHKNKKLYINNAKKFLQLLAPFAPFIVEELWQSVLKQTDSIHKSSWPITDKTEFEDEIINIPVQVNGKVRDVILIAANSADENSVTKKALDSEKIKKWIDKKEYKTIYIGKKIINIVTL